MLNDWTICRISIISEFFCSLSFLLLDIKSTLCFNEIKDSTSRIGILILYKKIIITLIDKYYTFIYPFRRPIRSLSLRIKTFGIISFMSCSHFVGQSLTISILKFLSLILYLQVREIVFKYSDYILHFKFLYCVLFCDEIFQ